VGGKEKERDLALIPRWWRTKHNLEKIENEY